MSGQKDGIFFPRPIIEHSETKPLRSRISFSIQLTIPLYDAHVNNVNLSGRFTTNKIFFRFITGDMRQPHEPWFFTKIRDVKWSRHKYSFLNVLNSLYLIKVRKLYYLTDSLKRIICASWNISWKIFTIIVCNLHKSPLSLKRYHRNPD